MPPKKQHKNDKQPNKRMPRWKRNPNDYRDEELSRLTFASKEDSDAAIDIVWGGQLTGIPFALDLNDSNSLIVPKNGVPYFAEAGIKFVQQPSA